MNPQAPTDRGSTFPTTPRGKMLDRIQWAIVAIVVAVALLAPVFTGASALFPTLMAAVLFVALHGFRRYGAANMFFFIAVTTLVSNGLENLSIATGFPFGHYHYSGGIFLFQVPIEIGPAYFALGYISWMTAATILDRADERLDRRERVGRVNVFILPAFSAAVMTMYDVGTDSLAATFAKQWVWHGGGGLFGVPYTNFLGWWFVTYLFFQIFALWLSRLQTRGQATVKPSSQLQPIIFYGAIGLSSVPFYFSFAGAQTAIDGAGISWNMNALNESLMVINLFSVVSIAVLALFKIVRGDMDRPR